MKTYTEPRDLRIIHAVNNAIWTLVAGMVELFVIAALIAAVAHLVMR